MQLRTKVIGAAGIAAVVGVGGFAFTASNALPAESTMYGFASQSVTGGVTVKSIAYVTDDAGANVTGVNLVLQGDTNLNTIKVGFNALTPTECTQGVVTSSPVTTPYTCTVVSQPTGTLEHTNIVATLTAGETRTTWGH